MITENDIKIDIVGSREMFDDVMAIRRHIFTKEQGIPKKKEFNRNDFCCAHVIAYAQKRHRKLPIGTMRIRFFGDCVMFERMAVTKNFRKKNVAESIMQYGFKYSALKGFHAVCGMCKKELLPRWQKCGYHEMENKEHVHINGMELIPICRDLEPDPKALSMISDFYLLAAEEGHWYDEPSKTLENQKPSRINKVLLEIKKIKQKLFNY